MSQHHDRKGTQLHDGCRVIYLKRSKESSSLEFGEMVGATDCYVKLRVPHSYRKDVTEVIRISPDKTVRI